MNRYYKEIDGNIVFFEGNVLYTAHGTFVNPSEEEILAEGWMIYVEPTPTPEKLLQNAKNIKIRDVEVYDNSVSVNLFYLNDVPMWLDAQTRQTLRISIESYVSLNMETVTKWFNGQQFTFTTTIWLQMLNALEVYAAEALNVTESHKAAIAQLETIEEVQEYDITVGYPEKLNFDAAWIRSLS